MKKNIVFTILLTLISGFILAQFHECGVGDVDSNAFVNRKWYGNSSYLDSVSNDVALQVKRRKELQSLKASTFRGGANNRLWQVPVKFWLYSKDDGSESISLDEVTRQMKILNDYFDRNGIEIHFYALCDITFINSSAMYNGPDDQTRENFWGNYHQRGAVNVHLTNRGDGWGGIASFPEGSNPYTMCIAVSESYPHTIAHEMGHVLSIPHTFQGRTKGDNALEGQCYQESVSRGRTQGFGCLSTVGQTKCAINGDGFCDTDAAIKITRFTDLGFDGTKYFYNGTGMDNWGDVWKMDPYNIMSYSIPELSYVFTRDQQSAMIATLYFDNNLNDNIFKNPNVDVFEPNDLLQSATLLNEGEFLHNTLHSEKYFQGNQVMERMCNPDWFTMTLYENQFVTIYTKGLDGYQDADTKMNIYNSNRQLVYVNNALTGNGNYAGFKYLNLQEGTYYVEITNEGTSPGHYLIGYEICAEECCFNPSLKSIQTIDGTTGPYNLAPPAWYNKTQYVGTKLTCNQNFFINKSDFRNFINNHTDQASPNTSIKAIFCENSNLNFSGQMFQIGDGEENNSADVSFQPNSLLKIESNSILKVEPNSKLILKPTSILEVNGTLNIVVSPSSTVDIEGSLMGTMTTLNISGGGIVRFLGNNNISFTNVNVSNGSKMIIGSDAEFSFSAISKIYLNGLESVLEIQGGLTIAPGATFTFSSTSGFDAGYLKISTTRINGDFITAGLGSSIRLQGAGKTDKILEIACQEVVFGGTNPNGRNLASIYLSKGQIEYSINGTIYSTIRTTLSNSLFKGNGQVLLFGQPGVTIAQCDFDGISIRGDLYYGGFPLRINNSNFKNSSIVTDSKAIYFTGLKLTNSRIVVQGTTDFTSNISSLNADNYQGEMLILSDCQQNIFINNSTFNNITYPITQYYSPGALYVGCSSFSNGDVYISSYEGRLTMNGLLNSGSSKVVNATIQNLYGNNSRVELSGGRNALYTNNTHDRSIIGGGVSGVVCGTGSTPAYLNANNNQWYENTPALRPTNTGKFMIQPLNCGALQVAYINDILPIAYKACVGTPDVVFTVPDPLIPCVNCIKTPSIPNLSLDQTLALIQNYVSNNSTRNNDANALKLADEVSRIKFRDSEETRVFCSKLLEIAKTAYGNLSLFDDDLKPNKDAQLNFMNVLNNLSPKKVEDFNYEFAVILELTKFSYMQSQKESEEANAVLENLKCGVSLLDEQKIIRISEDFNNIKTIKNQAGWSLSQIAKERDTFRKQMKTSIQLNLSKEIPIKPFVPMLLSSIHSVVRQQCNTKAINNLNDSKDFGDKARIYPNPAHGSITIETPDENIGQIVITNSLGQIIIVEQVVSGTSKDINIYNLKPGIYQLEAIAHNGNIVLHEKLIVE